jgi:hypothetical protein
MRLIRLLCQHIERLLFYALTQNPSDAFLSEDHK